jgi:ABC-type lipoprotein export system ATPase subunit
MKTQITRTSPIFTSFRVEQLRGMFDVPNRTEITTTWDVNLPIEERPWLIGLIVGASGSGKTTIANEVFKDAYIHQAFDWPEKAALIDGFDKKLSSKAVTETLSSVGLSSPPHWLKPFGHLSNGQKFRAELARLVLSGHKRVVFDEFTSVVDRDVAKICSATLAKTIRRKKEPQLVAVSCHFDVLDWLQPDWVYDVGANRFEWRSLQRRPAIQLKIYHADVSAWPLFRGHHYLTADISKAARCFVAEWNGKPVAFTSYLHHPHGQVANLKRAHRTVCLPDFQGVGIGNALNEAVAEYVIKQGFQFRSTTSHPAMIEHRLRSPKWVCVRPPSHVGHPGVSGLVNKASTGRITASFRYVGTGAKKALEVPQVSRKLPDAQKGDEKTNTASDAPSGVLRRNRNGAKGSRVSTVETALVSASERGERSNERPAGTGAGATQVR